MNLRELLRILRDTGVQWVDDNAASWAACLAFYTMLSIGPLIFTVVTVAGVVCGRTTAQAAALQPIEKMMGSGAAEGIAAMMNEAGKTSTGIVGTAIGVAVLIFGATGVFAAMQDAMNAIWKVQPKPGGGLLDFLKRRLLSAGMVLGLGFLLLVSLLLSSLTSALLDVMGNGTGFIAATLQIIVSLLLTMLLLAGIFKALPDAETSWRNVCVGAGLTATLLELGKFLIGLYLGKTNAASIYGAAGSLAVILLWVYYAAQILFLGAEFTQVFSAASADGLHPKPGAMAVATVSVDDQVGAGRGDGKGATTPAQEKTKQDSPT